MRDMSEGTPDRLGASKRALVAASTLAAGKLVVGTVSGSLALLASALDSFMDVLVTAGSCVAVARAVRPPDSEHAFGHGKFEPLAALAQSLFVLGVAGMAVVWAVRALVVGRALARPGVAVAAAAVSAAVSILITLDLRRTGRRVGSMAVEADSLHYATDIASNGAIAVGLGLQALTGWTRWDGLLALVVSAGVVWAAARLLWRAVSELADVGLPEEERRMVSLAVFSRYPSVVGVHRVRTRRAGPGSVVDLHVVACRRFSFEDAHALAEELEREVRRTLGEADVLIHLDPCTEECEEGERCPLAAGDERAEALAAALRACSMDLAAAADRVGMEPGEAAELVASLGFGLPPSHGGRR